VHLRKLVLHRMGYIIGKEVGTKDSREI